MDLLSQLPRRTIQCGQPSEDTWGGLPEYFCWTRIGPEAGQTIEAIRRRKELERSAGDGLFYWGIGSSLGDLVENCLQAWGALPILFSAMKSKAKPIDLAPTPPLLWTAYIDATGREVPLPENVVVTSRARLPDGRPKTRHYALICHSGRRLDEDWSGIRICTQSLRNVASEALLGASQVTAVVRRLPMSEDLGDSSYGLAFRAELAHLGFVRLVKPQLVTGEMAECFGEVASCDSADEWLSLCGRLRAIACRRSRL